MKKPITILYVDDNRLDRELVRDALTNDACEFKVVEAASHIQFDEYFAKGGYDLVLSDFNILGFEGLQVLEAIHTKSPDVPVIIVTGTGSEEVAAEAIKKGATDYVIKTTKHIRRLPHTIKAALEKKKMEQERYQVEKALSEAYNIINRSPAVAFLWKNEAGWPVEFVSENVEKLFGYSDKEFLEGKVSYGKIIHSSDLETVAAEVASYSKKEEQRTFAHKPYRIITKSGDIKWIDDITYIRRDSRGKITHYEGIVYDITERKQAEEALRESEEKFRTLFEDSQDAIYITSGDGLFIDFNQSLESTLGYSRDELLTLTLTELYKNNDDRLKFQQMIGEEGFVKDFEISLTKKDGTIIECLMTTSLRKNPKGNLISYQGIIRDITGRNREREKLEMALREAKRANKVKDLFMANMSHEIRTPLNAILGFTQLLEISARHLVREEEKEFFDVIKKSGNRLMQTVHEILDISQIEAGTYKMNLETFDLCQLIRDIINECKLMAQDKGLKLEYHCHQKLVFIKADQNGIVQAIRNILENAIKYTEQGEITVLLKQISEYNILSIQDTGIGIAKEYLDNLFEVFSQESEGYTKKYQGIGLGMAITKRYLDLNKVDIDIESTKGMGTTFNLTFKSVKTHRPGKQVEKVKAQVAPTPKSIEKPLVLLVEDDLDSQRLTKFYLKGQYDIYIAVLVDEAKQQLKKHRIDLILLDISLISNEDGLDLVRWMRKTKTWKKTPVIATTAHALTSDREKCLTAGCNDYLSKPIKRENLLEKISKVL